MDFILLFILIFFLNKLFVSSIVNKNPNLSTKLLNNLFLYHLFFFIVYYTTTLFSRSDSNEYYRNACEIGSNFSLLSSTGTQFIDNFAAPFASLGLSYESMMLLFSWFGYLGFVYAYLFFRENIPVDVIVFKRYDLLTLLLFLPNMHFWTASLGKGSLIFMGLMLFAVAIKKPSQRILILLLGGFFVYMIRPPVMIFVLAGFVIGLLTGREKLSVPFRITLVIASLLFLFYVQESIFEVFGLDSGSDSILKDFTDYANAQSDRLETSNSGVAMQSYSVPFKLFTFWFRPLFVDSPSILGIFSSAENLIYLLLFYKLIDKRFISFIRKSPYMVKMSAITFFSASYSMTFILTNLGIIMRQKTMVMYFGLFVVYYFLAEEKYNKMQQQKPTKPLAP